MLYKIAVVGYGNLGKAVESVVQNNKNFKLEKIFSRRKNQKSPYNTSFDLIENIDKYKGKIDLLFVTLGSYNDIEKYGYNLAKNFNTIDSFDTHAKLKDYLLDLDKIAKESKKVCLSAFGWDPGLMSLMRVLFDSIDQKTCSNCFWGKGVSQGHSDAIRRVEGVENAIQYTVPKKDILSLSRKLYDYSPNNEDKHDRVCFVSLKNSADKKVVKSKIQTMPNYFDKYNTQVNFVTNSQILSRQKNLSHKGFIFKNFKINDKYKTKMYFSLNLQSNPYFTAKIMLMGASAVANLLSQKSYGAYSILDIPVSYFSLLPREQLLSTKL